LGSGVTISNSSDLADSMGVEVYQSANVTISDTTISGHAYGVSVEAGGSAAVNNNRITANGTGIHVTDGGSLTSVTENFITGNTGDGILITATAGSVAPVFHNDLSGNGGLAVNNQSATTVDAVGNWWGTSTAAGVAAEISGNVDFGQFLPTGTDAQPLTPGFQPDSVPPPAPAPSPAPAPAPVRGVFAQLVKVGKAKRLFVIVRFADTGEIKTVFKSPFQTSAFNKIRLSVVDTNNDGAADAVKLAAHPLGSVSTKFKVRVIPV
jgi:hypothetical protein